MNKQLQHIATALLLLVLIGAGKAWGQTEYYYTCGNGNWSNNTSVWKTANDCSGAFVEPPNLAQNTIRRIQIKNQISKSDAFAFSGSTFENFAVDAGAELRIYGNMTSTATLNNFTVNGTLVIEGNMDVPGNITINPGGTLVVKGSLTLRGNIKIDGAAYISGNLSATSGEVVVNNANAKFVVGGNYTSSIKLQLNSGTINVLGNYSNTNTSEIAGGSITIIGTQALGGGNGHATVKKVLNPATDPVFFTEEGVHAMYWEDFLGKAGTKVSTETKAEWTIPGSTTAYVSAATTERLTLSVGNGARSNGYIWKSDEIPVGCYSNITFSAEITVSDNNKATGVMYQYCEIINGNEQTWQDIPRVGTTNFRTRTINTTAPAVKIRINTNMLEGPVTVTVDNIIVSGTKDWGAALAAIELADYYNDQTVCVNEPYSYRLSNAFSSYAWSVSDPASNTISNATQQTPTVVWNTLPATLTVTVKNQCGRPGTASWNITNVNEFNLILLGNIAPNCAGDNDGYIHARGTCSVSLTYKLFNSDDIELASNSTGQFNSLSEGRYKITANNGSEERSIFVDLFSPNAITIEGVNEDDWVTTSCDPADGCNGYVEFTYGGGVGALIPTLDYSGPVTFEPKPQVELNIESAFASLTNYPLEVKIDKSATGSYFGSGIDFSDVRFFANRELTIPLYYWFDTAKSTTDVGVFYVSIPTLTDGMKIYMIYGDNHGIPSYENVSSVLTMGAFTLEYYQTVDYTGTMQSCLDKNTGNMSYSNGSIVSDCGINFTNGINQSFIWKGWYLIPNSNQQTLLKVGKGTGDSFQLYIGYDNPVNFSSNGWISIEDFTPDIRNTYQYLEFRYSKPAGATGTFRAGFDNNNSPSNWGNVVYINPNKGFTRRSVNPEPRVTPRFMARYTGLCQGSYNLTVTDANGCSATYPFDIDLVNGGLEFDYFPSNMTASTADAGPVSNQTIYLSTFSSTLGSEWIVPASFSLSQIDYKFAGNTTASMELSVSTYGYSNIWLDLTAYQSLVNWASTDYLQVDWWNGSSWSTIINDPEVWIPANGSIENIPIVDGNNGGATLKYNIGAVANPAAFKVRITARSNSTTKNYFLRDIRVYGTINNSIDPGAYSTTNTMWPTLLEGPAGNKVPSKVIPYYYDVVTDESATCAGGITIERRWNAMDACGNVAPQRIQTFTLYSPDRTPTLVPIAGSEPSATTYSFCNRTFTYNLPHVSTNICTQYRIFYELNGFRSNALFTSTTAAVTTSANQPTGNQVITFPAGQSIPFSWIVVDPLGVEGRLDYNVTFGPEITASFKYYLGASPVEVAPPAFCEGDEVRVVVTPSGGAPNYTYQFSTTPVHTTPLTGNSGLGLTGTWNSTDFQDLDRVVVEITDSQGCKASDGSTGAPLVAPEQITIHEGITTNPIQPAP